MKRTIISLGIVCFLLAMTSACSTMIRFNTQKAADPRFSGIRTVGVNTVISQNNQQIFLKDNLGRWTVRQSTDSAERLAVLVRKALVSNLKRFSDYEVIDLHDLRKFQLAFQRLRPLSGERIGGLDLMIDIRVSYQAQNQDGNTQEVMTFRQEKSVLRGKKWVKVLDSSQQKVVTVPYSSSLADVMCYVEVIRTKNGDARVLKSFNVALSNSTDPMTTLDSMVNQLAVVITGRILMDVSKYEAITTREIDKDSDDEVIDLLDAAKLEAAARKLESILSVAEEKEPADLYNLGICYEALGDPRLALQMYQDALALDQNNELYMKAIGEIE